MSKYTLLYNLLVGFLLLHFAGFSQVNIEGEVTNKDGEALAGVTLQVLNSTLNAVTDIEGRFLITKVPEGVHELKIDYLGYATQVKKVTVGTESSMYKIILQEAALQLDEVIVGAQKREERLQKVPLPISSADAKKVESLQVNNFTEVGRISTNFNIYDDGGGFFPLVASRGIFTIDDTPIIATYMDDVPSFFTYNFPTLMEDVESVEILRGPQGTLYGRNALAGVIRIETKKPSNQLKGFARAGYGNLNQLDFSAGLGGAVIKNKLFARVSGYYNSRDGYITNTALDTDNLLARTTLGGNIRLTYLLNDQFSISLQSALDDRENAAYALVGGFGATGEQLQQLLENNPYEVRQNDEGTYTSLNSNNALRLNYQTDNISIKSITTFQHNDLKRVNDDFDFTEFSLNTVLDQSETFNTFTEEVRVNSVGEDKRVEWLGGAFFFNIANNSFSDIENGADNAFFDTIPERAAQYPYSTIDRVEERRNGFSLFGNATFKLTDAFRLIVGIRYERENFSTDLDKTFRQGENDKFVFPELGAIPTGFEQETTFEAISPKFGLSLDLSDETMLWANVARGYRPGGINPFTTDLEAAIFDEESSWNYEIGLKTTTFDKRLRTNWTAFYTDYQNQQLFTIVDLATFNFGRDNLGQSIVYGLELESEFLVARGLSAFANVAYMESEIRDYTVFSFAGEVNNAGNEQGYTPRWSGTVGLNFSQQFGENRLSASTDYQFQSDVFFDPENLILQEGYGLLNARLAFAIKQFEVSVWGKNLTDIVYFGYGYGIGGAGSFGNFGLPRTIGGAVSVRF
ncbi:MAG: TonB-dependent receptor [Bacteroidota bacterium]